MGNVETRTCRIAGRDCSPLLRHPGIRAGRADRRSTRADRPHRDQPAAAFDRRRLPPSARGGDHLGRDRGLRKPSGGAGPAHHEPRGGGESLRRGDARRVDTRCRGTGNLSRPCDIRWHLREGHLQLSQTARPLRGCDGIATGAAWIGCRPDFSRTRATGGHRRTSSDKRAGAGGARTPHAGSRRAG